MEKTLRIRLEVDGSICDFSIDFVPQEFENKSRKAIESYVDLQILEYIRHNAMLDYDLDSILEDK